MKRYSRWLLLVVVAAALTFVWLLFSPRHYGVKQLAERDGTRYWELPTGSRIAYTYLAGTGEHHPYPLIYLHGGPGAGITGREIETYKKLAAKGYDIYLYDQVGCGHSERLENINEYTAGRHRRDLEEIVKKINAEKVILVGQSWGSILAVMYLAENPSKVHRLVITAPAPIQPANKTMEAVKAPDSLHLRSPYHSERLAQMKSSGIRTKMMYYLAKHGIKLAGNKQADAFATYFTNELNTSMVCDTANAAEAEGTEGMYVQYMTSRSLGKVRDPRDVIKKLETPVLVMKAQCDNQPWGYTAEYLQFFPVHQFVLVKNAGHNIFLEQPDQYVRLIDESLQ